MDALVAVRRCIANAILHTHAASDRSLGAIELRPHQVEAVRRLHSALDEHGGALLSDAPGLGKTYTALAIAQSFGDAIVVAPAALKGQWLRSAMQAGVRISWCSLETLSRRPAQSNTRLLVVDEAHHLRNPRTQRYAHAAQLSIGKRVLLLSATPVHNRPADREALLALFLGAKAGALTEAQLGQIIVRRRAAPHLLPSRSRIRWIPLRDEPVIAQHLRRLTPPVPAADGRAALALIRMSLAHAWSSSVAALDTSIRRATLQAAALEDALSEGRWPTRRELRAWVNADDSSQLAFPQIMAAPADVDFAGTQAILARHRQSLQALRASLTPMRQADTVARSDALRALIRKHPQQTILAFSRYAATVDALWREMRLEPGVVAISSRGVRSAGGGIRRDELLAWLAMEARDRRRIPLRLVLSTEVLGEGLDVRAASVIVHLDLPWTAARLDQREGRATRLDSPHRAVSVYAIRPPRGAARLLAMRERISQKRQLMNESVAAGDAREALCNLVRPWLTDSAPTARVAAITAPYDAWVAVVHDPHGRVRVIAGEDGNVMESDERLLVLLAHCVNPQPVSVPRSAVQHAQRAIRDWLQRERSAHIAQTQGGVSPARIALARRFDAALRHTPLNERAALQARCASIMHGLSVQRGAGLELLLNGVAQSGSFDELLRRLAAVIDRTDIERPAAQRMRRLALLIFLRDARAATDPTPALRSAALSGTAATR